MPSRLEHFPERTGRLIPGHAVKIPVLKDLICMGTPLTIPGELVSCSKQKSTDGLPEIPHNSKWTAASKRAAPNPRN